MNATMSRHSQGPLIVLSVLIFAGLPTAGWGYEYRIVAPDRVEGPAGSQVTFTATVQLSYVVDPLRGWDVVVETGHPALHEIIGVSFVGTESAQAEYQRKEVTGAPGGNCSDITAAGEVWLDYSVPHDGIPAPLGPGEGPFDLMQITVRATVPAQGDCDTCSLLFSGGACTSWLYPHSLGNRVYAISTNHTIAPTQVGKSVLICAAGTPPANQPPVVDVGPDVSMDCGGWPCAVGLQGSAQDDGLLAPLDILWQFYSGPGGPGSVTFDNPADLTTAAWFSQAGTYVLELQADDGQFYVSDWVQITVTLGMPNQAPVVDAGPDVSMDCGGWPCAVGLQGGAQDDGSLAPLDILWQFNSGPGGPGSVTFDNPADLTTAAWFSQAGTYVLELQADDGQFYVSDWVQITVTQGQGDPDSDPTTGLPTPAAHWKLDESAGSVALDSAGENHGVLHGNPIWLPEAGIIDGALALDGFGDYVRVETVGVSGQDPRTIAGWVRANTTQVLGWTNVFGFTGPSGPDGHFDIEVVGQTGTTAVGHYAVHVCGWQQNLLPIDQEWHHFAATYDGAQAAWYADGALLGSKAVTVNTEATIQMGKRVDNDKYFSGQIDDVRVYDEALSGGQIRVAMAATGTIDWHRAVYRDPRYPSNWVHGSTVSEALASAGYEILDADQLKTWMDARIADGAYSVVVFCQDVTPDTVYEAASSTCTLRRYLDAGGKIVWYGDIPLYYQGHSDGTMTTFDLEGSLGALGFRAAGGVWEIGEQVTLTDEGRVWGLTYTWPSVRPAEGGDLRVLARDSSGLAAAWVKHYLLGDTYTGFVRFSDCPATPNTEDIWRLAEYPNALSAPGPEGLVAHYEFEGNTNDSAAGHHGTEVGNPAYVIGATGLALDLDGAGDYVNCGNPPALNLTDEITVAAWVRTRDAGDGQHNPYVTKGDHSFALKHHWQNNIEFFIYDGDWQVVWFPVDASFNGLWHHLAGTYDGRRINLYVDGILQATREHIGSIAPSLFNVNIGRNSEAADRFYEGQIDEVRIYDRALSQTEMVDLVAHTD